MGEILGNPAERLHRLLVSDRDASQFLASVVSKEAFGGLKIKIISRHLGENQVTPKSFLLSEVQDSVTALALEHAKVWPAFGCSMLVMNLGCAALWQAGRTGAGGVVSGDRLRLGAGVAVELGPDAGERERLVPRARGRAAVSASPPGPRHS